LLEKRGWPAVRSSVAGDVHFYTTDGRPDLARIDTGVDVAADRQVRLLLHANLAPICGLTADIMNGIAISMIETIALQACCRAQRMSR
jgi:hypothetical protein